MRALEINKKFCALCVKKNMQILHSKIYGQEKSGTPLLVFHGLFGMLDNWGSFGKEFGELFPTHLIDLRNHGKSFHSDEMNHQVLADDILNYMNFHGIEKANLLGHSLGGHYRDWETDRKSTRLNSSHITRSRMPSSA